MVYQVFFELTIQTLSDYFLSENSMIIICRLHELYYFHFLFQMLVLQSIFYLFTDMKGIKL